MSDPQTLEKALVALRARCPVILIDDASRQHSAYFVADAATITPEDISYMVNHGRGIICAAVAESKIKELGLPMMASRSELNSPDFTVSVEARQGVTTGISAADRACTLRTLATTRQPRHDLVTPGHIFPLRAKSGGVLVRNSAAEAAADLLRLAVSGHIAALCECLNFKGDILSDPDIQSLIESTRLPAVSISDITRHRLAFETIVERIAKATLPVRGAGEFEAHCFRSKIDDAEHLALVKGDLSLLDTQGLQVPVLTRVQAEHRMSDLLGSHELRSRKRMHAALQQISATGRGVFIYVRHPRQGTLREQTGDGKPAPSLASEIREHGIGAQILRELGVKRIQLLSNVTRDIAGINAFQLEIVGQEKLAEK